MEVNSKDEEKGEKKARGRRKNILNILVRKAQCSLCFGDEGTRKQLLEGKVKERRQEEENGRGEEGRTNILIEVLFFQLVRVEGKRL